MTGVMIGTKDTRLIMVTVSGLMWLPDLCR